jgi:hypothetical protein
VALTPRLPGWRPRSSLSAAFPIIPLVVAPRRPSPTLILCANRVSVKACRCRGGSPC